MRWRINLIEKSPEDYWAQFWEYLWGCFQGEITEEGRPFPDGGQQHLIDWKYEWDKYVERRKLVCSTDIFCLLPSRHDVCSVYHTKPLKLWTKLKWPPILWKFFSPVFGQGIQLPFCENSSSWHHVPKQKYPQLCIDQSTVKPLVPGSIWHKAVNITKATLSSPLLQTRFPILWFHLSVSTHGQIFSRKFLK